MLSYLFIVSLHSFNTALLQNWHLVVFRKSILFCDRYTAVLEILGSYDGEYGDDCLLGYFAMYYRRNLPSFQMCLMLPSSGWWVSRGRQSERNKPDKVEFCRTIAWGVKRMEVSNLFIFPNVPVCICHLLCRIGTNRFIYRTSYVDNFTFSFLTFVSKRNYLCVVLPRLLNWCLRIVHSVILVTKGWLYCESWKVPYSTDE